LLLAGAGYQLAVFKIIKDRDMKNRKIVIIDEDKKFLGELEEVLTASGYSPVVVNDAFSAVDIVVQRKPDVILLELKMSSKNGFELANEMTRVFETQRIPIIAMASFLKDESFPLMNLCGIKRYLKKPFHPLDVISAIEDVIQGSRQLEERVEERRRYGYPNEVENVYTIKKEELCSRN